MTADWVIRLPKSIRVAAYDFRILVWTLHEATAAHRYGEFSSIEQCIRVQAEFATLPKLVDTMLHEVTHAIYWAYGINDEDKEERIVSAMGTAWTQVWRDNPDLLDWLHAAMVEVRAP